MPSRGHGLLSRLRVLCVGVDLELGELRAIFALRVKSYGAFKRGDARLNTPAAGFDDPQQEMAFRASVTPVYDKFRQSGQGPLLDKALAAVK